MTKRRLMRWSLILFTFAAFPVWLEPTRVVWGWLRGEAFYQGRPTSYWRYELARLKWVQSGDCWWGEEVWTRQNTQSQEWLVLLCRVASFVAEFARIRGGARPEFWRIRLQDTVELEWLGVTQKQETLGRPEIISGDLEAEPILLALHDDPSASVRYHANLGLLCIRLNQECWNRQGQKQ